MSRWIRHFLFYVPSVLIKNPLEAITPSFNGSSGFFKENQVTFEDNLTLNMGQNLSIPAILPGIWFISRAFKQRQAL